MDIVDSTEKLAASASLAWTWVLEFLPRLGAAVLIAGLGYLVAHWTSRAVANLVARTERLDPTFVAPIAAVIRYSILIFVFVAALSQLGVQTASVLAALGAAGLAIGLALQGTLSNIAAGVMLLWLRPFRAGENIDAGGIAGVVREVGLFVTLLETGDGVYRFVPNSELWNRPLLNYSRHGTRQVDLRLRIAYGQDVEKARRLLIDLAKSDRRVRAKPAPDVFVAELGEAGIVLAFQSWVSTADFGTVQHHLIEEGLRRLLDAGMEIPAPQRVVLAPAPAEQPSMN